MSGEPSIDSSVRAAFDEVYKLYKDDRIDECVVAAFGGGFAGGMQQGRISLQRRSEGLRVFAADRDGLVALVPKVLSVAGDRSSVAAFGGSFAGVENFHSTTELGFGSTRS